VSDDAALLLRAEDWLRFVPDGKRGTSASVTCRAWDQTDYTFGQQGHPAAASGNGGATPFSENCATSHIAVSDVNDAPELGLLPGPQTINEDTWLDIGPAWVQITDVDSGDQDIELKVRATSGTLWVDTEVVGGVDPGDVQGNGSGSVTITA